MENPSHENNSNELTEMEWLELEQEKEMIQLAMERSMSEMHNLQPSIVNNNNNNNLPIVNNVNSASERSNFHATQNSPLHNSMPALHHSYNHHYPEGGRRDTQQVVSNQDGMDRHHLQEQHHQQQHRRPHHREDERFAPSRQDGRDRDYRRMPDSYHESAYDPSPRGIEVPMGGVGGSMRSLGNSTLTRDISPVRHRQQQQQQHRLSSGYRSSGSFREVEEATEAVVDSPHHSSYDRMGPSTPMYHDRRASPAGPLHSNHNYDYRASPASQPYHHTPHSNQYGRRMDHQQYQDDAQQPSSRDIRRPRSQARNAVLHTARQQLSEEEAELVEQALRLGIPSGHSSDRRSSSHAQSQQQQLHHVADTQHSGGSSRSYGSRHSRSRDRDGGDADMTDEERRQLEEALQVSRLGGPSAHSRNRRLSLSPQETMDLLARAQALDHLSQEELDDIERALLENASHSRRRQGDHAHHERGQEDVHGRNNHHEEQRQYHLPPGPHPHFPPDATDDRPPPSQHANIIYEGHPVSSSSRQDHFGAPSLPREHHRRPFTNAVPRRTYSADSVVIAKEEIQRAMAANRLSQEEYSELMGALEANGNGSGIHRNNDDNDSLPHLPHGGEDAPGDDNAQRSSRPRLHEDRQLPGRAASLDSINDRISDHSNRFVSERTLVASGSRFQGQQQRRETDTTMGELATPFEEPEVQPIISGDLDMTNERETSRLDEEEERPEREAQDLPDGQRNLVEQEEQTKPVEPEQEQAPESEHPDQEQNGDEEADAMPCATIANEVGRSTHDHVVTSSESTRPPTGSKGPSSRPNSSHPSSRHSRNSNPQNSSAALGALPYATHAQGAPGSANIDMEYSVSKFGDSMNTFGSDALGQQRGDENIRSPVPLNADNERFPLLSSGTIQGVSHLPPSLVGCDGEDGEAEKMLDEILNPESGLSETVSRGSLNSTKAGVNDDNENKTIQPKPELVSDSEYVHKKEDEKSAKGREEQADVERMSEELNALDVSPKDVLNHSEHVAPNEDLFPNDIDTPVVDQTGHVAFPLEPLVQDQPVVNLNGSDMQAHELGETVESRSRELPEQTDLGMDHAEMKPEEIEGNFLNPRYRQQEWEKPRGRDVRGDSGPFVTQERFNEEPQAHRRDPREVSQDPHHGFNQQHEQQHQWADRHGRDPRGEPEPFERQQQPMPMAGHRNARQDAERHFYEQQKHHHRFADRHERDLRGGPEPFVMQERLEEQLRQEPREHRARGGPEFPNQVEVEPRNLRESWGSANSVSSLGESTQYSLYSGHPPLRKEDSFRNTEDYQRAVYEHNNWRQSNPTPMPASMRESGHRLESNPSEHTQTTWPHQHPPPPGHRYPTTPGNERERVHSREHDQGRDRVSEQDRFDEDRGGAHPREYDQERDRVSDHDRFDEDLKRALYESIQMQRKAEPGREYEAETAGITDDFPGPLLSQDQMDHINRALAVPGEEDNGAPIHPDNDHFGLSRLEADGYAPAVTAMRGGSDPSNIGVASQQPPSNQTALPPSSESMALGVPAITDAAVERALQEAKDDEERKSLLLARQLQEEEERIASRLTQNQSSTHELESTPRSPIIEGMGAFGSSSPVREHHPLAAEVVPAAGARERGSSSSRDLNASLGQLANPAERAQLPVQESFKSQVGAVHSTSPVRERHPLEDSFSSIPQGRSSRQVVAARSSSPDRERHLMHDDSRASLPQRRSSQAGGVRSTSPVPERHSLRDSLSSMLQRRQVGMVRSPSQAGAVHSTSPVRERHPLDDSFSSPANDRSDRNLRQSLEDSHNSRQSSRSALQMLDESRTSHLSARSSRTLDHARRPLGSSSRSQIAVGGPQGSPQPPHDDSTTLSPESQRKGKVSTSNLASAKESPPAAGEKKSKEKRDSKVRSVARLGKKGVSSLMQTMKRGSARFVGTQNAPAGVSAGRAEKGRTGGDLNMATRIFIDRAIHKGIITQLNGVVKYGNEATLFHADKGPESGGFDVAVKIYKRAQGLGLDQGNIRQTDLSSQFQSSSKEQLELWTIKEYRNLKRARRAGVPVPTAVMAKQNILFMQFLGLDGRPSPQLGELDLRRGHKRWKALYKQIVEAVRRLYTGALLVHGNLSENNILVVPRYFIDLTLTSDSKGFDSDQAVLIDFGQTVDSKHPDATELLRRDLQSLRQFFVKQGIRTPSVDDALQFIMSGQVSSTDFNKFDETPNST